MAFCEKCGAQANDNAKFCPSCGATVTGAEAQQQSQGATYSAPGAANVQADPDDVQKNKMMAILGYLIFFIPLLTGDHQKSPFVKFHTNQGTILAITGIIGMIFVSIIPFIGLILLPFIGLALFVLFIIGILNAANGTLKQLPVIGKFTIIK